jgi:[ribosomal protein S5]-alanine N-acetyltransferase
LGYGWSGFLRKVNEMKMETKRLILRELTMEDLEGLHKIFSDPESMRHYPKPFTLEETKKMD